MRRIAIVGSRTYPRLDLVRTYVAQLPAATIVVSGGAQGVDRWATVTAINHNLETLEYRAHFKRDGRGAGLRRNHLIVDTADHVTAFWDAASRGTAHTIKLAYEVDKLTAVCGPTGQPITLDAAYELACQVRHEPMKLSKGTRAL